VRDALGYLDGLASEQPDDPALLRELAGAYRRVGDVQGGDQRGLGDARGAVESYTKALTILEQLYRQDSTDVTTRKELASLALAVGGMVWERGDLATGLAHSRRARELLEPLVAVAPADTTLRVRLHGAYDLLGQMSLEAGEVTQALEFHRADLRQLEAAPASDRAKPWLRRAISVAYGHLADAQNDVGDLIGALESHRRSLDLRVGLATEFPDNADYDYLQHTARYYMGTVLSRMGRWKEALALHEHNLARDSASGFTQYRVGEALLALGRYAEALPRLRQAAQLGHEDFVVDSASLFRRMGYAMVQSGICKTLAKLARPDAATTCARTARFVELTPVEPTHAFPRAHFAAVWFELGEGYEALADRRGATEPERRAHRETARDMYRRSHEIWTDLMTRKLISPVDTSRVGMTALAVARVAGSPTP
jgi:tetratricopeptide (TPR) repeat protein